MIHESRLVLFRDSDIERVVLRVRLALIRAVQRATLTLTTQILAACSSCLCLINASRLST